MRHMQFDRVNAEPDGALGRLDERAANAIHSRAIECAWKFIAHVVRDRRRRVGHPPAADNGDLPAALPRNASGRLASRMGKLDPDRDARMLPDLGQHRAQRRLGRVVPEAKVGWRDAAVCFDRGRFEEQDRGAREREISEMNHVPPLRSAVFR